MKAEGAIDTLGHGIFRLASDFYVFVIFARRQVQKSTGRARKNGRPDFCFFFVSFVFFPLFLKKCSAKI